MQSFPFLKIFVLIWLSSLSPYIRLTGDVWEKKILMFVITGSSCVSPTHLICSETPQLQTCHLPARRSTGRRGFPRPPPQLPALPNAGERTRLLTNGTSASCSALPSLADRAECEVPVSREGPPISCFGLPPLRTADRLSQVLARRTQTLPNPGKGGGLIDDTCWGCSSLFNLPKEEAEEVALE